jgi:hypothetical protein
LDKLESVLPYAFWFGNPNAHLNCRGQTTTRKELEVCGMRKELEVCGIASGSKLNRDGIRGEHELGQDSVEKAAPRLQLDRGATPFSSSALPPPSPTTEG